VIRPQLFYNIKYYNLNNLPSQYHRKHQKQKPTMLWNMYGYFNHHFQPSSMRHPKPTIQQYNSLIITTCYRMAMNSEKVKKSMKEYLGVM